MSEKPKGNTDRWRVIQWLEEDLEYYKNNIGEVKEHGKTVHGNMSSTIITQKLIDSVTERIAQLEELESIKEQSEINRKDYQKV